MVWDVFNDRMIYAYFIYSCTNCGKDLRLLFFFGVEHEFLANGGQVERNL